MYYLPFHRVRKGFWVIQENEVKEAIQDHKVNKDQQEMLVWKDRLYVITAFDAKQLLPRVTNVKLVRMPASIAGRRRRSRFDGFSRIPRSKSMCSFFSVRS